MNYEKVDSVNSTRSVQLRQKKNKTKIEKNCAVWHWFQLTESSCALHRLNVCLKIIIRKPDIAFTLRVDFHCFFLSFSRLALPSWSTSRILKGKIQILKSKWFASASIFVTYTLKNKINSQMHKIDCNGCNCHAVCDSLTYFSLLKFNYASRNAKPQVKARATLIVSSNNNSQILFKY